MCFGHFEFFERTERKPECLAILVLPRGNRRFVEKLSACINQTKLQPIIVEPDIQE